MRTLRVCVFALVLFGAVGLGGAAMATALSPIAAPDGMVPENMSDGLVIKVSGCHRGARRHWVHAWGRRARHRHVGPHCRPVLAGRRRHCHRGAARHYHDVFGRRRWHAHRGPDCFPVRLRRYYGPRRPAGCFQIGPVWYCP